MNLQDRIDDISSMGINRTLVATNALVHDIVEAIAYYTAIPAEELMKFIEDGAKNE